MDERIRLIALWNEGKMSVSELGRAFGISRKTVYKWVARYAEHGAAGLEDRTTVAHHHPHATAEALVSALVELRKERPTWGPKKLRARLAELGTSPPAASTIGELLKKHGLIRPRRRRVYPPRMPSQLAQTTQPNDTWCVDFKGHFALGDKSRCHPLTITDQVSRYLLKCESVERPDTAHAKVHFERAFREYGLPLRIRSDNGPPFATAGIGGLSELSVWWIKLGIQPERIEPGHPEQNGRHERMHRTLGEETARSDSSPRPRRKPAVNATTPASGDALGTAVAGSRSFDARMADIGSPSELSSKAPGEGSDPSPSLPRTIHCGTTYRQMMASSGIVGSSAIGRSPAVYRAELILSTAVAKGDKSACSSRSSSVSAARSSTDRR